MPLGDGKGPPDGSGPLTGRKRFADACRAFTGSSTGTQTTSSGRLILTLIAGAVLLAGWLMTRSSDRER
ncbi:MAG TPA: hypothetical protein ENN56_04335 [Firmicutes bacterium]|nr:hypothetical protein [Bacillota bacterium]